MFAQYGEREREREWEKEREWKKKKRMRGRELERGRADKCRVTLLCVLTKGEKELMNKWYFSDSIVKDWY